MNELAASSAFFGVVVSIAGYAVGCVIHKKWKLALFQPLLISIVSIIVFLLITGIKYQTYYQSAKYLSDLLTPATVCFAVPMYEQIKKLRKNIWVIIASCTAGVLACLTSITLFSLVFGFSHTEFISMLPKSITTAIGIPLSEEYQGIVPLTVAAITVTGIFGNVTAKFWLKLFGITERFARGLAIGSSCHAIGTVKAFEMGQEEGAASSLAIVVCGLLTVVAIGIYVELI